MRNRRRKRHVNRVRRDRVKALVAVGDRVRRGSVRLLLVPVKKRLDRKACIMSHKQQYEATEWDFETSSFRTSERADHSQQRRPAMGRRRGKAPNSFNGMHRRRRRKINW